MVSNDDFRICRHLTIRLWIIFWGLCLFNFFKNLGLIQNPMLVRLEFSIKGDFTHCFFFVFFFNFCCSTDTFSFDIRKKRNPWKTLFWVSKSAAKKTWELMRNGAKKKVRGGSKEKRFVVYLFIFIRVREART